MKTIEKDKCCVLFDFDGVIVDSYPTHKEAVERWCREQNVENITEEKIKNDIFGRPNHQWISDLLGLSPGAKEIQLFADRKEEIYQSIFETSEIKLVVGLEELLSQLKNNKIPMAIVSSAPRSNIDIVIQKHKLESFFNFILDDTSIVRGKPNPAIYLLAVKKLNTSPSLCVVFEDSPVGIEAAKGAGCKVVGVATTFKDKPERLSDANKVISDFTGYTVERLMKLLNP